MTFTTETYADTRFVKVNGITRFIYMAKRGWQGAVIYRDGILVVGLLGWCVVFAPFARGSR